MVEFIFYLSVGLMEGLIFYLLKRVPGGGVLRLWPNRGTQSGSKRAKSKVLKYTLKW